MTDETPHPDRDLGRGVRRPGRSCTAGDTVDSITVRLRDSLHEAVDHVVEHGGTVRISSAFGHPIGKGYSVEIEFPVTGTEAVAQAEAAIGHKDHARLDADAKLLRLQDRETNPQANPSAVLGPVRRGGRHV